MVDVAASEDVDRTDRGPRRPSIDAVLAVALAIVTFVLATVFRTVIVPTDPWHYVQAALDFPSTAWNAAGLTRYGVIFSLIPFAQVFGNAPVTYYTLPILCSGVLVALVYLLGTRLFGRIAGLVSAVLFLTNTVVFVNLTRMYPDLMATTLVTGAVYVAVLARDRWQAAGRVDRRAFVQFALVGLLLGWSWQVRETAIMAWPVPIAVLWWRGGPPLRKWFLPIAVPVVAAEVLDLVVNSLAYGKTLWRIRMLMGADLAGTTNPADLPYLNHSRLYYLTEIPRVALETVGGRWMLLFAVLAVLGLLIVPRRVGLVAGWFVLLYIAFSAVGGGMSPGHPSIRLDVVRYWIFFLAPMTLAAVGTVTVLLQKATASWPATRRRVGAVALGVLAVVGPIVTWTGELRDNPTYAVHGDPLAAMRDYFAAHDGEVHTVWSDWMSTRILPIYQHATFGDTRFHAQFKPLGGSRTFVPQTGDYVVLFSRHDGTCFFCRAVVNQWLSQHHIPSTWKQQYVTPDGSLTVYRVESS